MSDCLTRKIDAQALMDLANINDKVPKSRFSLGGWLFEDLCGTIGCLIGNYCKARPEDRLKLTVRDMQKCTRLFRGKILEGYRIHYGASMGEIAIRFNLSRKEALFLFSSRSRSFKDKGAAVRRVRKLIYYKLHRQEMLADYEGARRKEGDHNFVNKALESVSRSQTEGAIVTEGVLEV